MMSARSAAFAALLASVASGAMAAPATPPAKTASNQDRAFVAAVSQGGMYEVELGKVAAAQGSTQDIKDQGYTEAHDHEQVGQALKTAADSAGLTFPATLNPDFTQRLAKVSALSGIGFDRAYIADMKRIHAADGAQFLRESKRGTNPDLKAFAASTYNIVQRHLGQLNAKTTTLN